MLLTQEKIYTEENVVMEDRFRSPEFQILLCWMQRDLKILNPLDCKPIVTKIDWFSWIRGAVYLKNCWS